MGWGAAIGAIASLIGSGMQSRAAGQAGDAQREAGQAALDWTKQVYDRSRGDFAPYMGLGQQGASGLAALYGGDYSGLYNSPDFKVGLQTANDQFNNGSAARFRLFSGGAQNDRDKLNQDYATMRLGDYRNGLMGLSQMGQNAAAQLGGIGTQTSQQISQNYGDIGAARANSAYYQGGIWGHAANQAGQAFSNYWGGRNSGGTGWGSSYGVPAQGSGAMPGFGTSTNYQSGGNGTFWGYT